MAFSRTTLTVNKTLSNGVSITKGVEAVKNTTSNAVDKSGEYGLKAFNYGRRALPVTTGRFEDVTETLLKNDLTILGAIEILAEQAGVELDMEELEKQAEQNVANARKQEKEDKDIEREEKKREKEVRLKEAREKVKSKKESKEEEEDKDEPIVQLAKALVTEDNLKRLRTFLFGGEEEVKEVIKEEKKEVKEEKKEVKEKKVRNKKEEPVKEEVVEEVVEDEFDEPVQEEEEAPTTKACDKCGKDMHINYEFDTCRKCRVGDQPSRRLRNTGFDE